MAKQNKRHGSRYLWGRTQKLQPFGLNKAKREEEYNLSLPIIICERKQQETESGSGGKRFIARIYRIGEVETKAQIPIWICRRQHLMEGGLPRLDWRENREREGDTARENGRRYKEETEEGWGLGASFLRVCVCSREGEKTRPARRTVDAAAPCRYCTACGISFFLSCPCCPFFFVSTEIRKRIHEPIVMTGTNVKW